MADAESITKLEELFRRLPLEHDAPALLARRIRITTQDGRTVFAFVRAGQGPLAFAGWEATVTKEETGEVVEPAWKYFVLASPTPDAPLQVIAQDGPVGTLNTVELEDRPR
jgi:hypothetical protein